MGSNKPGGVGVELAVTGDLSGVPPVRLDLYAERFAISYTDASDIVF